ncbi:hypothetical protein MP638_003060, partial [Amoeboaphelidium occidentale]
MLHNYIIERNNDLRVVRLLANKLKEGQTVANMFNNESPDCNIDKFFNSHNEGVLLIDEGQMTYQDAEFWKSEVKNTYEGRFPGVRVVIFSSFGSFNPYRKRSMTGTPIKIEERDVFRLYRSKDKPGMQLTRE